MMERQCKLNTPNPTILTKASFRSPRALTFWYGCTVHVGVDVGAGDIEVDVIYVSFIMSVQYIGYLVPTIQRQGTSGQLDN